MARLLLWAATALLLPLALTPSALASPQPTTTFAPTTAQPSSGASPARADTASPIACNNSPDLCSRAYSSITHMGAHDSAFVRDASTGYSLAGNQFYNATVALSAGIRLLQAQVHLSNGVLELCHTYCSLLDAGPLDAWLAKIKAWLDAHPNDVVTLLLVNSDNQPADAFGAAFERAGIAAYAFTPGLPANTTNTTSSSSSSSTANTATTWPTLQEMIATNARLVTFIAPLGAPSAAHPYLLDEFAHVFETPYNITSSASFTCALDRPATDPPTAPLDALAAGRLPLLNHFAYVELSLAPQVLVPDVGNIDVTNDPGDNGSSSGNNNNNNNTGRALGEHLRRCAGEWQGRAPAFVLVDFFNRGPAVRAADRANGIEPVGREEVPSAAATVAAGRDGGVVWKGLGMGAGVAVVVGLMGVW